MARIIFNFDKDNIPINKISLYTKLPEKEIVKLREEYKNQDFDSNYGGYRDKHNFEKAVNAYKGKIYPSEPFPNDDAPTIYKLAYNTFIEEILNDKYTLPKVAGVVIECFKDN